MNQEDKWIRRWIDLACHVAQWSKDPSTKVGAVVVGTRPGQIAVGFNGFPRGIADDSRLDDRPTKYRLIQHAERNVLDNATFDLLGATLVVTKAPCGECSKSIVQKGINRVVCPLTTPDDRWFDEAAWGNKIMDEAGIFVDYHFFDAPEVLWHQENGGHRGRLAGHALRLLNEAVELCVAAGASDIAIGERVEYELKKSVNRNVVPEDLLDEIADVQVLLNVLAHHAGHASTRPLVDKKLEVLRERKWEVDRDGVLWRPRS